MVKFIRWWVFPALIILLLASCKSGGPAIQPIDGLPGGFDGPQAQNITAHSTEIVFKSKAPIVCNVAYGTDTQYGHLALMAMTSPTTDHDVMLVGLEPATTYHYRITLTDQTARVYQSGDFNFTTLQSAGTGKPSGVNAAALAAGGQITGVSSNYGNGDLNSAYGGNKAIDGNPNTAWSSNGDGDKAWIEIGLEQTDNITSIGFWTRTMGSSGQISSFRVVTDDGTHLGPFTLPDAATIYYFPVNVKAKSLRFEVVSSSGGNTGAVEIEAYAG
jgi:hypothetical protein